MCQHFHTTNNGTNSETPQIWLHLYSSFILTAQWIAWLSLDLQQCHIYRIRLCIFSHKRVMLAVLWSMWATLQDVPHCVSHAQIIHSTVTETSVLTQAEVRIWWSDWQDWILHVHLYLVFIFIACNMNKSFIFYKLLVIRILYRFVCK